MNLRSLHIADTHFLSSDLENMMRRIPRLTKGLSIMVIAGMLFVNTTAAACADTQSTAEERSISTLQVEPRWPSITMVATLDQFLNWHTGSSSVNSPALLEADIVIDSYVELPPVGRREIAVNQPIIGAKLNTIRVVAGGTLVINNPDIYLTGQRNIITVESGGTLHLNEGEFDVMDGEPLITVKKGAFYTTSDAIHLDGVDQIVTEEADPGETPDPEDPRTPITNIFEERFHLTCLVGEEPDGSEYPQTAGVTYGEILTGSSSLPVVWDTSTVDFNRPGTYTIIGRFTEEGLEANGMSNPKNFTVSMTITVCEESSIERLRGELLSIDSKGNAIARIIFPALPEDVTALYLFTSSDGVRWEPVYCQEKMEGASEQIENFIEGNMTVGANSFLSYHYVSDYRPLWVKAQVVGSVYDGMTNEVKITLPAGTNPGDQVENGSDEDDGDSGGNRGGGTQGETERDPIELEDSDSLEPIGDKLQTAGSPGQQPPFGELEEETQGAEVEVVKPDQSIQNLEENTISVSGVASRKESGGGRAVEGKSNPSDVQVDGDSKEDKQRQVSLAESMPADGKIASDEIRAENGKRDQSPWGGAVAAVTGGLGVVSLAGYFIMKKRP